MQKVHGQDALNYVVGLIFTTGFTIDEVQCGIDIDNAARYYERSYYGVSAETVYWTILNYLSGTKSTVAEYFSAEVDDNQRLVTFYIHTDLDDCESRGIRYEFAWA